jgi:hypothetical protein
MTSLETKIEGNETIFQQKRACCGAGAFISPQDGFRKKPDSKNKPWKAWAYYTTII